MKAGLGSQSITAVILNLFQDPLCPWTARMCRKLRVVLDGS